METTKIIKKKVAKRPKPLSMVGAQSPGSSLPAPVTATLSPQASELVRWYCGVTRHREEKAVEGAVYGALGRARAAYEDGNCHDEAFNVLLEDVLVGIRDDERGDTRAGNGGHSVKLDVEASLHVQKFLQLNGAADLRDVVSAAVVYALEMTMRDRSSNRTGPDKEVWGYFQEPLAEATERRREYEADCQQRAAATAAYRAGKEVD